MYRLVNIVLVVTVVFILSSCGGSGGSSGSRSGDGAGGSQNELGFVNGGPIVTRDSGSEMSVTVATNLSDVSVAYIIKERDASPPEQSEYFGELLDGNRFQFSASEPNTNYTDENSEALLADLSYTVYLRIQKGDESVSGGSFTIESTSTPIVADAWEAQCTNIDNSELIDTDVTISLASDLAQLDNIQVIDGTLEISASENIPIINLPTLTCVRRLVIHGENELRELSMPELHVVDLVRLEGLTNPLLQSVSFPNVTSINDMYILSSSSIQRLNFPLVERLDHLVVNTTAIETLDLFSNLTSVDKLILSNLENFEPNVSTTLYVNQELRLNTLARVEHLQWLNFGDLTDLSLINVPLTNTTIYSGDHFDADFVNIVKSEAADLNVFLASIGGIDRLRIIDNDRLTQVNFQQSGRMSDLEVIGNELLETFNVPDMTQIDNIAIGDHSDNYGDNASLQIVTFPFLEETNDMIFVGNSSLTDLDLSALTQVSQANSNPSRCDFVGNGLANIDFPELREASCRFWFKSSMMSRVQFHRLETLNSTSREFLIGGNSSDANIALESLLLPELVNAENTVFRIIDNTALSNIDITNLQSVQAMNISGNSSFSQCQAEAIWERLGERGLPPTNNDTTATCNN